MPVRTGECTLHHMQPVCEAPKYCKDDPAAVYLGQTGHLLRDNDAVPAGFDKVRHHWRGRCSYAGLNRGGSALCQRQPKAQSGTWHWFQNASAWNPGFICATVQYDNDQSSGTTITTTPTLMWMLALAATAAVVAVRPPPKTTVQLPTGAAPV